jgi:hypothetical protein
MDKCASLLRLSGFVTSGALSIKLHSDKHIFITKRLRDRKISNFTWLNPGGGILYLYEHSCKVCENTDAILVNCALTVYYQMPSKYSRRRKKFGAFLMIKFPAASALISLFPVGKSYSTLA